MTIKTDPTLQTVRQIKSYVLQLIEADASIGALLHGVNSMPKHDRDITISLLDDLQVSLSFADHALSKAKNSEEHRIATLLALAPVYDFLKSVGVQSRALRHLSMALQDVDRGQAPAIFQPSIQHRPKEAAKQLTLKAAAAAAVQLLMDSGETKKEAGATVAMKLVV